MRFVLVVFDKSENGEDKQVTPHSVINGLTAHLYVKQRDPGIIPKLMLNNNPTFIWVNTRGDVNIPKEIALRDGWRTATEQDEIKPTIPKFLTYFFNSK